MRDTRTWAEASPQGPGGRCPSGPFCFRRDGRCFCPAMPFKTHAGSACAPACQRRGDDAGVIGQRADDRMLVEEAAATCCSRPAGRSTGESCGAGKPREKGRFRRLFPGLRSGCRRVRLETPCSTRVPSMPRALSIASAHWCVCGPMPRTFPRDRRRPFQAADLLGGQVLRVRAESSLLVPHVDGDLLEASVENPHHAGVPARPDGVPQILRRHGVVRLGHFHVTVTADLPRRFLKTREPFARQRPQHGSLYFEKHPAHVPPRRAVNPRVGHRRFPMRQVVVLAHRLANFLAFRALFCTYFTPLSTFPLCRGMYGLVGKITTP